jgi:translocator protein
MNLWNSFDADASAAWYRALERPFFAPPDWIFGPVWTVLYVMILCTFGYLIFRMLKRKQPWTLLAPMLLNLVSNLLYTPLQFGLRSNELALVDIVVVLGSLIWLVVWLWKAREKYAALALTPYLLWVSFATVLQASVTWMNR